MMKIGIIGYGNMGSAIAQQLKNNYDVLVFEKDKDKIKDLPGIAIAASIAELAARAGIIIFAVKPQDFEDILSEIGDNKKNKLFISIAAGISTAYIEKKLGAVKVIRAMPNMPARICEGMTCLAQGEFAGLEDLDLAENLFDYLGETLIIEENMMNQATAVSGSGPAYVCNFLESQNFDPKNIPEQKKNIFLDDFQNAAQGIGFNAEDARFLVNTTFNGTISFLKRGNLLLSELRYRLHQRQVRRKQRWKFLTAEVRFPTLLKGLLSARLN